MISNDEYLDFYASTTNINEATAFRWPVRREIVRRLTLDIDDRTGGVKNGASYGPDCFLRLSS